MRRLSACILLVSAYTDRSIMWKATIRRAGSLALRLHRNQRTKTHRQILLAVNPFSYMLQVIR
jgi:hypothetical protein